MVDRLRGGLLVFWRFFYIFSYRGIPKLLHIFPRPPKESDSKKKRHTLSQNYWLFRDTFGTCWEKKSQILWGAGGPKKCNNIGIALLPVRSLAVIKQINNVSTLRNILLF